jgi:hypothetical protein
LFSHQIVREWRENTARPIDPIANAMAMILIFEMGCALFPQFTNSNIVGEPVGCLVSTIIAVCCSEIHISPSADV